MLSCWRFRPDERPSFDELEVSIAIHLGADVAQRYIDLNGPCMEANAIDLDDGRVDYPALMGPPNYQAQMHSDVVGDHGTETQNAFVMQSVCPISTGPSLNLEVIEEIRSNDAHDMDQIEHKPKIEITAF